MKIYTKKGDAGQTSLLGGVRVPKHHLRIEAYGTVDELNSYLGVLKDQMPQDAGYSDFLKEIQDALFTLGSPRHGSLSFLHDETSRSHRSGRGAAGKIHR